MSSSSWLILVSASTIWRLIRLFWNSRVEVSPWAVGSWSRKFVYFGNSFSLMQVLLKVTDEDKDIFFFSFFSMSLNAFLTLLEQRARVVDKGLADAFRARSVSIFKAEGGMADG